MYYRRGSFVLAIFSVLASRCNASIGDLVVKSLVSCAKSPDFSQCLSERCAENFNRMSKMDETIELVPNAVLLERNADYGYDDPASSAKNVTNGTENSGILDSMGNFFRSRSLTLKFPVASIATADDGTTGRKKDKNGGVFLMGAWMVGTALAMKMAALAVLSGKALMTSVLAFMLAAIAAFSKKSGGHTHGSTYEVINVPPGGHNHARRVEMNSVAPVNEDFADRKRKR